MILGCRDGLWRASKSRLCRPRISGHSFLRDKPQGYCSTRRRIYRHSRQPTMRVHAAESKPCGRLDFPRCALSAESVPKTLPLAPAEPFVAAPTPMAQIFPAIARLAPRESAEGARLSSLSLSVPRQQHFDDVFFFFPAVSREFVEMRHRHFAVLSLLPKDPLLSSRSGLSLSHINLSRQPASRQGNMGTVSDMSRSTVGSAKPNAVGVVL